MSSQRRTYERWFSGDGQREAAIKNGELTIEGSPYSGGAPAHTKNANQVAGPVASRAPGISLAAGRVFRWPRAGRGRRMAR
ncbi:MAG TPA: hypothetical protein VFX25_12825 [Streptosporangiaceae bacterium]|nr:hypothetical protein [Streptosporangiaceae bacterium]